MKITDIEISNFRNIKTLKTKLSQSVNVILGKNAQGKTNLLESIYFFTGCKSFRANKDSELINFESDEAKVSLYFYAYNRQNLFEVNLYRDKKRRVLLNGVEIKKASEIAGIFNTVLFAPEHLNLIKEGPRERRKFLDIAISQLKPKYVKALDDYNKILVQKNALLKDMLKDPSLEDTLDIWNDRLANAGAYITFMRDGYISKLSEICKNNHEEISKGKEILDIKYMGFSKNLGFNNVKDYKDLLIEEIKKKKADEIRCGLSIVGPHRDDVDILINGKAARLYASQGQQRSAVLSIKIAEADIVYSANGEQPVILLDDIFSELDRSRQNYILKKIKDKQVVITSCDKGKYKSLPDAAFFNMHEGCLTQIGV